MEYLSESGLKFYLFCMVSGWQTKRENVEYVLETKLGIL